MNNFTKTTEQQTPTIPPPTYADRQFMHTFLVGAFLPLLQAMITAIMVGVGALVILSQFNLIDPLKPTLIASALTMVLTWLYLQRRWLNLTALEKMLNLDINRDGQIGEKPKKKETVIWINDESNGAVSSVRAKLSIGDDDLIFLADGLVNRHRPFSRREWIPKANGFSRDEWDDIQSDCLKFKIVEVKGAGFELTKAGKAVMRYYASLSPTPLVE